MKPVIVTVSCPSANEAAAVVREVVRQRLAAAGQTWPITSVFWWDGELVNRQEHIVLFKTVEARVDRVMEVIGATHSYDTPSIAVVPVARVGPGVESWLGDSTQQMRGTDRDSTVPELV
ncbi:divalent-cation tolerance protein CutA [Candidatus Poriferisodalis sp.]|uniref:divalent-cation tolerance protein CutA n=1 Tax=Candidatus Poriferisodalis sp. TaxID=3101277 RepID=UPI003B01394B